MANLEMVDIPQAELAAVLADLALQPEFEVVGQPKKQPNGLFTIIIRSKPAGVVKPVHAESVGVSGAILRRPSGDFRRPNGPVVMALQMALIKAGVAMEPDGDFGKITCDALRRWQSGQGLPQSDSIDAKQWEALTGLPPPSLFDLCLNIVSDYEGTRFDRVVGNFDGAGITFGLIGFTLVNGEIRKLLNAIETLRPGAVAAAFGGLHSELMEVLSSSKTNQLAWADGISLGAQKVAVAKPWKDAFERIGQLPEFSARTNRPSL